ncbi:bifunctional dihydrofolate reductase-thymidylate synthase-like isoform X1 [Camellia sinensis]|uniref:bifunctional dihydrofolate reductase-thymidylate synthase-like isoform X1 n=2 Tax=Camellia sinensis TaxID=4442 RepID=UPI0010359A3E|nr:bifunctional dihydrofolate reductase-thymidylate synthase-like isoform X1 [Camellia sinensis]XP_028087961.1 bifunctional dihydrofolate reductase-thymidylate synthase-like isoform X1 [Camellia sinensis]XP_028087962.1 bifunctional dihydrofolate reductase-thymidylate synthase-like isoform X1 [Camellia sinensis]
MCFHMWRQIMGTKTNIKESSFLHCYPFQVLLSSYRSCFFSSSSVLASSQLFGVPNVIAKYRSCLRYSVTASNSFVSLSTGDVNMQPDLQRTYQVVVAATHDMGIGKDGKLPWWLPSDLKFFSKITMTTSDPETKNAVVMGRKTWESIPLEYRPLPGRLNVLLTRSGSLDIATAENVVICGSIPSALELLARPPYCFSIEKVFIIGGGQILREVLNAPGCDAIHMTEIESSIECDTSIPPVDVSVFQPWYSSSPQVENNIRYCFVTYVRVRKSATELVSSSSRVNYNSSLDSTKFNVENFTFLPRMIFEKHDEFMYLRLVQDIISSGNQKDDGTGTGSLSKFGCQMQFNLRKCFPLLTTKRLFWRGVVEELLWFISGSTNAKVLQEEDIHIWDANASRDYLDSIGLADRDEGDLGPIYGFQWRHFGARYTNMHADYTGQGFDQLLDVIDKIRNKPDDRRILLSAWNPSDLKLMALPPCHMFAQFYVAHGELSCQMYQWSADIGLRVPFNIASYALLTCIIAHVCGLVPGDFIHVIGDAHVYKTHIRPLQEQLYKLPKPFPILKVNPQKTDIDSFVAADFKLIGYDPHQKVEMEIVV